jgi:pyridoxine/pyridoxamine 5'-phosphate oxidase
LFKEENPYAAMSFWWPSTARAVRDTLLLLSNIRLIYLFFSFTQIRIDGQVTKLSSAESDNYFYSLPRDMQIATVVNVECKRVIPNRQVKKTAAISKKFIHHACCFSFIKASIRPQKEVHCSDANRKTG